MTRPADIPEATELLAHRIEGGHWLIFDTDKLADGDRLIGPIVGCHCGFTAELDSDCGAGDSVLDHFEQVVRADERAKIADEIEAMPARDGWILRTVVAARVSSGTGDGE